MTIVGDIRPSQLLFSYGTGSLINLPKFSAVVLGMDYWNAEYAPTVVEERLLSALRSRFGPEVKRLALPPVDPGRETSGFGRLKGGVGLPLALFPQYMVCTACQRLAPVDGSLFCFKEHAFLASEHCFIHDNCTRRQDPPLIPARFFVVCENGHMDDFPWHYFVHRGNSPCPGNFKLFSKGPDVSAVMVKCERCQQSRPMSDAFSQQTGQTPLPRCQGIHVHLGTKPSDCDQQMKAMSLGASNTWFPHTLSVLSIPFETHTELEQRIDKYWANLQLANSIVVLEFMRNAGQIPDLQHYSLEQILAAVEKRRLARQQEVPQQMTQVSLFEPEYRVLCQPEQVKPSQDFEVVAEAVPAPFSDLIEQVVLVKRLREVRALTGFSRINSPDHFEISEAPAQIAPLARRTSAFYPVSEVRGEGIFLVFRQEALLNWQQQHLTEEQNWLTCHTRWRQLRKYQEPEADFPGLSYILLHSFSHALMRQLSLECGYSAASIRERIYCQQPENDQQAFQAGVLLYTASPDAEGTLGGLVELGHARYLGYMIEQALENMLLCSSDPLCAEHALLSGSQINLHAASCHACLFAPETSCERGNRYLDRALLVPTLSRPELHFFHV